MHIPDLVRRACSRSGQIGFALGLAALALSACSLAGDVTPPPGSNSSISSGPVATGLPPTGLPAATGASAAQPTGATSAFYPATMPAAQDGGLLFLQHCAPCHGQKGAGDGSMATQLPSRPPDLSNPATLREQTSQVIFNTITQGRQDKFMPPFANSLTDAQRWSLVSFLYTLSTPQDHLTAGQAVYAANCVRCHGQDGLGKGPDAAQQTKPVPSFADQAFMASKSQQDFFKVVSGGDAAHPFTNLSEADRWAALDAVRAFSYVYVSPDQLNAERKGSVTGKVVNGTTGASVPGGLAVTLHGFDGQSLLGTYTTTIGADGGFQFANVPFTPSRQFIATTTYESMTYSSQAGTFDVSQAALSVTLPIYETTVDPSALAVDQVHMFLDFTTPAEVTVGQLYIFSNHADRAYASSKESPLKFSLPAGATKLNVQNGQQDQNYFPSGDGFSLIWPVPPGQGSTQILFSFALPYNGSLSYQQKVNYPISNVDVLVSDLGVQLSGSQLQNLGVQNFQGQSFQDFSSGSLTPGQTLSLQVSGKSGTGATAPTTTVLTNNTSTIAIGLGALAVVLLGIGVWVYRRPAAQAQTAKTKEDLLEAIAELDDAYAAGEVADADYQKEREQLKADLRKVWG